MSTKLEPIKFWCQKVLPLVYDDSLSYYEVLGKTVDYLNKVIEDDKNIIELVNNLEVWVNENKEYIDNYFENLNVQNEINVKLDEMVEDGTFGKIIDPILEQFEQDAMGNLSQQVSDWLEENITPTTPVIDATLTISGAGADAKVTGDEITDLKNAIGVENASFTSVDGHYIYVNGNIGNSAVLSYSNPIPVNKGNIIEFTASGYLQNVAMISLVNSAGTIFTPKVISIDSDEHKYVYTVEADGYISVSYWTDKTHNLVIKGPNSNDALYNDLTTVKSASEAVSNTLQLVIKADNETATVGESGYFINNLGNKASHASFYITNSISLSAGDKLTVKATGYLQGVAIIAKIAGSIYTPLVISEDSTEREYTYIASDAIDVVISSNISTTVVYSIVNSVINDIGIETNELHKKVDSYVPLNILPAFSNITCIGDSLTYSQVYTGASTSRQAYVPYPTVIERKTGATVENIATAGASTSAWWDLHQNEIAQKSNQLAIVYLGTNEGLTDTIDTDCAGDDYTQWANTNTGAYGKIIAKLLSVNSRVVLVKCYASTNLSVTNSVIDKFATKFNIAVIDAISFTDAKYHKYPDGTGSNSVHYNDFGYSVFADKLIQNISELSDTMMSRIIPA